MSAHSEPAPLVSVVNVTYDGKRFLNQYLPSLAHLAYPAYEVIIVDNASRDGSVEFVQQHYPDFKIIRNDANLGTAQGSNVAIDLARGEYIFWVSNDMLFDADILTHLIRRCQSASDIGICTAKMLRIKNEALTDEIDSVGGSLDIFGFPDARGINQKDRGQFDASQDVFFSFGGAMLIKKDVLRAIGGFDPVFFTLADDIDLCWRARLAGWRVVVEPRAFLYHRVSATLGATHTRAQKRYLSERNTLRMLLKNYSLVSLYLVLPVYLVILSAEFFFFLALGKLSIAQSLLAAVQWNVLNLQETLVLRKGIQSVRRVSDFHIISMMLKRSEKIRIFIDFLFNFATVRWQAYF